MPNTSTRSDRKPPLAMRSPIRLRPRRHVQSESTLQSPSAAAAGTSTKSCLPKKSLVMEEHELRPEYQAMSCELNALTKMVQDTLRGSTTTNTNESPMFQRGKLYEEYSARRNERLKRKRGESVVEKKTPCKQYLGVRIESGKRPTTEAKKFESAGRKMAATPTTATQKYSLRSSSCKENKKPPLAAMSSTVERKTGRKGY